MQLSYSKSDFIILPSIVHELHSFSLELLEPLFDARHKPSWVLRNLRHSALNVLYLSFIEALDLENGNGNPDYVIQNSKR